MFHLTETATEEETTDDSPLGDRRASKAQENHGGDDRGMEETHGSKGAARGNFAGVVAAAACYPMPIWPLWE